MLSVAELERLLQDIESRRVERKASAADADRIREAICAFANDTPGHGQLGIVFVGVHDDGRCANLKVTDELLRTLADMRSDGNTLPPPTMSVRKENLSGCELAVIEVLPSLYPPVRHRGRVWVRVGPRRAVATQEEETRLAERNRSRNLPFDMRAVEAATLADLDLVRFRYEYLPAAIAPEVLAANNRTIEEQLRGLRFLSPDGRPTFGALLVLGKDPPAFVPGAYVQFLRIDGRDLTDPIRNQRQITGPIPDLLRRLDDQLEANVSIATDIASHRLEQRRPDYPMAALRQLSRNAVMHRNYESSNAPVRVHWFADRIEIHNPGGLYGQVNRDNFGKGATDYRNPGVAEGMRVLNFVQRFGAGIELARKDLRVNGNPEPVFDLQPNATVVTLRARAD